MNGSVTLTFTLACLSISPSIVKDGELVAKTICSVVIEGATGGLRSSIITPKS